MKTNVAETVSDPAPMAVMLRALRPSERDALERCERMIQAGTRGIIQALKQIRDDRLYREQFDTFEDYVRERLGRSARHAHRLCDWAEVEALLMAPPARPTLAERNAVAEAEMANWSPPAVLPSNESQARALKSVPDEQKREVWDEALAAAPAGKQPTAKGIEEVKMLKKVQEKYGEAYAGSRPVVVVEWERVAEGGDIWEATLHAGRRGVAATAWASAAQLWDCYGVEELQIMKAFEYGGQEFVVSLSHVRNMTVEHEAHELIPDNGNYTGPRSPKGEELHGRLVLFKEFRFRLGPTVVFTGVKRSGPRGNTEPVGEDRVAENAATQAPAEAEPEREIELKLEGETAARPEPMGKIEPEAEALAKRLLVIGMEAAGISGSWKRSSEGQKRAFVAIARWHLEEVQNLKKEQEPLPRAQKKAALKARLQEAARARWAKAKRKEKITAAAKALLKKLRPKAVKPNREGVYPNSAAEKKRFSHGALKAEIRLLELESGEWIEAESLEYAAKYPDGKRRTGLLVAEKSYGCREDALIAATGSLLRDANVPTWQTVNGRIAAGALSRWLHKLRKEARKVKMGL